MNTEVTRQWRVSPQRRRELLAAIRDIRSQRLRRTRTDAYAYRKFTDYTPRKFVRLVAEVAQIGRKDIVSKSHYRHHSAARYLVMWLSHRYTACSYQTIANYLDAEDEHTTSYGIARVEKVVLRNRWLMPKDDACPVKWACAIWEVWGFADWQPQPRRTSPKKSALANGSTVTGVDRGISPPSAIQH